MTLAAVAAAAAAWDEPETCEDALASAAAAAADTRLEDTVPSIPVEGRDEPTPPPTPPPSPRPGPMLPASGRELGTTAEGGPDDDDEEDAEEEEGGICTPVCTNGMAGLFFCAAWASSVAFCWAASRAM